MLKAMGHPLRHQLLMAYNERVSSPVELSKRLGEPLGNVAYHTRTLLDLGALELVDTRPRRGATEHFYRATLRPYFDSAQWGKLPLAARRSVTGQTLERIFAHISAAASSTGFDDERVHVSITKLDLDEQGHDEVASLLTQTLERVLEIQAESASRTQGPPPITTEVAMVHFHRNPIGD
jgi:DNA-binding transcriptional ArsR family regulator